MPKIGKHSVFEHRAPSEGGRAIGAPLHEHAKNSILSGLLEKFKGFCHKAKPLDVEGVRNFAHRAQDHAEHSKPFDMEKLNNALHRARDHIEHK